MERTFRGALSRATARVVGSRFAMPIARAALAAAGLALLAFVGRTAIAGAGAASAVAAAASGFIADATSAGPPSGTPSQPAPPSGPTGSPLPSPHARATSDDPVVLNEATESDLRRLPGIGAKRADAILALRAHLGRFRALEDLLKVKGIGRSTLKRLRPLVRLDPPAIDAGLPRPASVPSP
jgi:competence protein ComEA